MSISIVRAEIERFLRSPEPEVLCISGKWGVGKTFAWQKFMGIIQASGELSRGRYAYVSLFGINSLAELKNSIVENTINSKEQLSSPDSMTLYKILRGGEKLIRQNRPALEVAAGFFRMKDAGDALYRAAFLNVKEQLICFDDLERAGDGLNIKDVLGLASSLREQRKCKVVLLLNIVKANEEDKIIFNNQLEKVVDTFLLFEPTSVEAIEIAIEGSDPIAEMLRRRIQSLSITNIRVIKKIERWARQLANILDGYEQTLLEQAIATVTLAGWSFLQPDDAPPREFLESFRSMHGLFGRKEEPANEQNWSALLKSYGFGSTDELDREILKGVFVGYFDDNLIREVASQIQDQAKRGHRNDTFSLAWKLYHENLTVDDDVILNAMYNGAIENLGDINAASINATVKFLRNYDRNEQASELIKRYIDAHSENPDFFSAENRLFFDEPVDAELAALLDEGRAAIVDARNPADMLRSLASSSGFNPEEDVARLSILQVPDLVALFDENAGSDLRSMIEWANRLANQPGADTLKANMAAAMNQIASRSPMREDRLRSWGFLPQPESAGGVK